MDCIRWINHAGFELQTGDVRLVCDPWLDGLAFNQSWALISETKFTASDFAGVDYLWFSHEHPDHFVPRTLRQIPAEVRASIKVLFQKTRDGRVAKFCRELGFAEVLELDDWERIELATGVFFSVKRLEDDLDSLCFIETPFAKYLNINDCVVRDLRAFHEEIVEHVGRPDVLLTQFSFANWAGNPGDVASMRKLATEKLEQIRLQLAVYRPRILIPFASFVWFCRSDNYHMNAGVNRISAVFDAFKDEVDCVVLYPDDVYTPGSPHDSVSAVRRYEHDMAQKQAPLELNEASVSEAELSALSASHAAKIRSRNWLWLFRPLVALGRLKPVHIHLTDLGRSLKYSMFDGISWTDVPREQTDIEFTSSAMAQMLRHGTGYDTLFISGRFAEHRPGARLDLSRQFVVLRRNETGQFFPSTFFNLAFLKKQLSIARS